MAGAFPQWATTHSRIGRVRGIVFDWDGTLADSHTSLFEANQAVMRALDLPFTQELYREHYTPNWRLMYESLGVPAHRVDEANAIWQAAFHGTRTTTLLPGALDALVALREAGIPVGLVTAGARPIVEPQIERLKVADLLPVRVFADDLLPQKPDPAPLRRALAGLGLADRPADAAYLGDAPDDMRMAVAARVLPVGVVSPLSDRPSLVAAGAVEVVDAVVDWVGPMLDRIARRAS
jgi:HAD superfamily hydrolase (TIGR01549 family)